MYIYDIILFIIYTHKNLLSLTNFKQQSTATQNIITLKGSVDIVTEFFAYSINSILYQRGIYPPGKSLLFVKININIHFVYNGFCIY